MTSIGGLSDLILTSFPQSRKCVALVRKVIRNGVRIGIAPSTITQTFKLWQPW